MFIWIFFLLGGNCLLKSFTYFGVVCFFLFICGSCLYILGMSPLLCVANISSYLWLAFVLLFFLTSFFLSSKYIMICLHAQKFLILMQLSLFIFFLVSGFYMLLKKSFLSSGHEDSLQYYLLVLNYPIWQPLVAI